MLSKAYGVARVGGLSFADDPTQIRLASFAFRPRERFVYHYDFGADWQQDIRVEQILPRDPVRTYPVCIGSGCTRPSASKAQWPLNWALRRRCKQPRLNLSTKPTSAHSQHTATSPSP